MEEEVAKKSAELEAQLKAMEAKFARENQMLHSALSINNPTAAHALAMRQMDSKKRAIAEYTSRVKLHLAEYKRELIRLEEALRKVQGTWCRVQGAGHMVQGSSRGSRRRCAG